jgi:hypothetical protein
LIEVDEKQEKVARQFRLFLAIITATLKFVYKRITFTITPQASRHA